MQVNFTKKAFEENKVLLNEIVKQIAEETETVKTEVNQASIEDHRQLQKKYYR